MDYTAVFDLFEDKYANYEQDAGYILSDNLQDRSERTGFSLAGWKPRMNTSMQAVEWFEMDFEYGNTPVSGLNMENGGLKPNVQPGDDLAHVVRGELCESQRRSAREWPLTSAEYHLLPVLRGQQLRFRPARIQHVHSGRSLHLPQAERPPATVESRCDRHLVQLEWHHD